MGNTHPESPPESAALIRALAAHPEEMAQLIEALHRRAYDAGTLLDLMGRISREAVRLLDGVRWAGVTAQFDGPPLTAAHTDNRVLIVDEQQYISHDGPCLRAMRTNTTVRMNLAELGQAWPHLARRAAEVGVHAVLALPLLANGRSVGALNLYSADGDVPVPDPDLLTVLTEYAGRGLADFQDSQPAPTRDEVLRRAGTDSANIQQAVGALMLEHGFAADYAHEVLVDQAQDWGRTLSDQAAHVISDSRPD